jgi:hypothetical protein
MLTSHGAVAAARNRGAAEAVKQVLSFLDADLVLGSGALLRARSDMSDPGSRR